MIKETETFAVGDKVTLALPCFHWQNAGDTGVVVNVWPAVHADDAVREARVTVDFKDGRDPWTLSAYRFDRCT